MKRADGIGEGRLIDRLLKTHPFALYYTTIRAIRRPLRLGGGSDPAAKSEL
jgi:hypothetical protein